MLTLKLQIGPGGSDYREYVLRNSRSLAYCNPAWMAMTAQHLGAEAGWIEARRHGALVGLIPFLRKAGPAGSVWNSLAYYGSNGGAILALPDDEVKANLIRAFYEQAASDGACAATAITNPLEGDASDYDRHSGHSYLDERIGQVTHFPVLDCAEQLIDHFQDPRPRNIRRAVKAGVCVTKSHAPAALSFLFETHVNNMVAIGGQPKSRSFFEGLERHLSHDMWAVFLAHVAETPVAALLVLYFNKTVEYFTPAIVESYRNTQALSLVIYEAMKDAIAARYDNWNWGGTWLTQSGVYDFKKRWCTSEYRYYYYTRVFDRSVLSKSPQWIQATYPGFYVVPYRELPERMEATND